MDTTIALRQVQEARGRLTQALADLIMCRLDFETYRSIPVPAQPEAWYPMPDPATLVGALTALDLVVAELRPGDVESPVPVRKSGSPIVPADATFARIPRPRIAGLSA